MTTTAEQILAELTGDVRATETRLKASAGKSSKRIEDIMRLHKNIDEAAGVADERRREALTRINEATVESMRKQANQDTEDFGRAVLGYRERFKQMGLQYEALGKHDAAEAGLIEGAKQGVRAAETELGIAEAELKEAESKWKIFGFRRRAVARALARIDSVKAGIASANQRLVDATAEAEQRKRARLMNSSIDQLMQEYADDVERNTGFMEERRDSLKREEDASKAERSALMEGRDKSAQAVEKIKRLLVQKQEELRLAEEKLASTERGTEAFADQDKVVIDLRTELGELTGALNTAQAKYASEERGIEFLNGYIPALQSQQNALVVWISQHKIDLEIRSVTFRNQLEIMKGAADAQVAEDLKDVGVEMDQRGFENAIATAAASQRSIAKLFEQMGERFRAVHSANLGRLQAQFASDERLAAAKKEFETRWGTDPLATSPLDSPDAQA